MKYILAISQQRGMKRTAEESENDEELQNLEEPSNDSLMEESVVLPWKLLILLIVEDF